jgi:SAM-dependent methyltransferase
MGLHDDALLWDLIKRAERHAATAPQFGSLVGARQYSCLYSMVRRHVARWSRVLDWGAGTGHFGYFLARSGYQATGFEMSSASRLDWVGQPYVDFATGDLSEPVHPPFPDASFDAVVSVGVLEHVRETGGNELASLAEIRRVTRPGGSRLPACWMSRCSPPTLSAEPSARLGSSGDGGSTRDAGTALVRQ